jgi:lipopolysaccharide transport system permease protein
MNHPFARETVSSGLPVTVYTSESVLRNPGKLLRTMFRDLLRSRELAWRLFVRDVSAQYRQSILGYVWVFIPPLVAGLPFIFLNSQGIIQIGDTAIPYAAYAIIGTTIWQVFADALNAPMRVMNAARSFITRINLPMEAVLLSALGHIVLGFLARLVLVIGVLFWFRLTPPATAVLFPLGILSLVLVGFVIGVLIAPLGMLYGDVQQMVPIATTFLMLLTPVVYPVPQSGAAATVAALNPLTPLVVATRDWLTTGGSAYGTGLVVVTAAAVAVALLGWIVFRVAMPHLIARIGN